MLGLKTWRVSPTYSTSQFGLATLQVLNNHMWLVATILGQHLSSCSIWQMFIYEQNYKLHVKDFPGQSNIKFSNAKDILSYKVIIFKVLVKNNH